ncbi:MAG TPA: AAA family ATPase [Thermoleophilaceae bacterium]|jgi:DNA-binding CsgD family transcriptional regulator
MERSGTGSPIADLAGDKTLLEREHELASLDVLIAAAAERQARVAVVEGRAGIGKSRLIAAAREHAAASATRVLSARGTELEREFPYGVVRQLFEPLRSDPDEWERLLEGAAASARPLFEAPSAADGDGQVRDASFAALHGLYWLVVNLTAETPLMLAVDDLHWCDRPSLRFLAYLAPRLEGLPLLLVTGLRTGEAPTDPVLLDDVVNGPAATAVHPGPLSAEAVTAMIGARLGPEVDERFAAACLESTAGNPLLLGQLISSLAAEGVVPDAGNAEKVRAIGPRAVSRTVLLRLSRLSPGAMAVARAVAVLGENAELAAIAALAELDETAVAEATASLARADILRHDLQLGFVHPLVHDAVYQDLPPGERELQHARAARVLLDGGAAPDQVATHLLMTPRRGEEWVVDLLVGAARSAVRKGATDSAIAYLRRALEEPPPEERRADLVYELGFTESNASAPDAVGHLRQAYELCSDPRRRADSAFWLSRLLMLLGDPDQAAAIAAEAIAQTPAELEDERQALQAQQLTVAFWGGGDLSALDDPDSPPPRVSGSGPGAKMLLAHTAVAWVVNNRPAAETCAIALDSLAGGVLIEAENGYFTVGAAVPLVLAERREGTEVWDACFADAHRRGSLFGAMGAHMWHGWTLIRLGNLPEAEASLRTALTEMEMWGNPRVEYTLGFLAWALIERGRLDEARTALERVPLEPVPTWGGTHWRRSRVELLLAEGRPEEALAALDEVSGSVFARNPALFPWRTHRALALDALGRTDEAIALAEEELAPARQWGAPATVARTLRILGTLQRDEGLPRLEEAAALLERSTDRLEHAKALTALGSTIRRARQPTEAREPLRRALELAAACGADGLVEHVRAELAAAGAQPRTTALSGVEALTASERRVAGLAAEGQTNRDIAQVLYVTPKTVEVHLSNAYRKLGIRSRRELSGAMAT